MLPNVMMQLLHSGDEAAPTCVVVEGKLVSLCACRLDSELGRSARAERMMEGQNDGLLAASRMSLWASIPMASKVGRDVAWQAPTFPMIEDRMDVENFLRGKALCALPSSTTVWAATHRNPILLRKMGKSIHPNSNGLLISGAWLQGAVDGMEGSQL